MDYNIAYEISNLEAQAGLSYVSLQKQKMFPIRFMQESQQMKTYMKS